MSYKGHLDVLKNGVLSGWVINTDNIDESPIVNIYVDNNLIGSTTANIFREDLRAEGLGSGCFGFSYDINHVINCSKIQEIKAIIDIYNYELIGSPLQTNPHKTSYPQKTCDLENNLKRLPEGQFISIKNAKKTYLPIMLDEIISRVAKGEVVFIIPPFLDWNIFLFQRLQHMCKSLARRGVLTIFCSANFHDSSNGYYLLEDNLYWTNEFDKFEDSLYGVWFDIYSTGTCGMLSKIESWRTRGNKILYEYVDHIDEKISGSWTQSLIEFYESMNTEIIDLFIATANNLYIDLLGRFNKEYILLSQNAVDTQYFTKKVEPSDAITKVMAHNKPIIGYMGALASWLDYKIIEDLAKLRKDLSFVYLGMPYNLEDSLPKEDNIFYLEKVSYEKLSSYVQYFDVCFIPFKKGKIADTTSPLKLFEYFASQKPTVTTSFMKECVSYPVVLHGKTIQELSQAIDNGLILSKNEEYKKTLLDIANKNSWDYRCECLLEKIYSFNKYENGYYDIQDIIVNFSSGNLSRSWQRSSIQIDKDIRASKISFGFVNPISNCNYVSVSLSPKYCKYNSFSAKFTSKNDKKHEQYILVQVIINSIFLFEYDMLKTYNENILSYTSKNILKNIEVRLIALKDIDMSWQADTIWKMTISNIIFDRVETHGESYFASCTKTKMTLL